jgi:hypothetical protein
MGQFGQDNPEVTFLLEHPEKVESILRYQERLEQMNWKSSALKFINSLWKGNQAYFFHEPVDPVKLEIPNYFQVVKTPMDLSTAKKKLQNNMYDSPRQFLEDVNLIYDNCIAFNGEESFVGKIAVGFKSQVKNIMETLNFQHYLNIQEEYKRLKEEIFQLVRQMMAECKYVPQQSN